MLSIAVTSRSGEEHVWWLHIEHPSGTSTFSPQEPSNTLHMVTASRVCKFAPGILPYLWLKWRPQHCVRLQLCAGSIGQSPTLYLWQQW